jgi:hypothetical protein
MVWGNFIFILPPTMFLGLKFLIQQIKNMWPYERTASMSQINKQL